MSQSGQSGRTIIPPGTFIGQLQGDTGAPVGGAIVNVLGRGNVIPGTLANSGIQFTGNGVSTLSATVNYINMPNTNSAGQGIIYLNGTRFAHGFSNPVDGLQSNTFLGRLAGNLTMGTGAIRSTGIGRFALTGLTDGFDNTAVGYNSMSATNSGAHNTALGLDSLAGLTSGSSNTAIGQRALNSLTTGLINTAIGMTSLTTGSGSSYTGNEAYNLLICNDGAGGEQHTIRIGNQANHGTAVAGRAFMSGIGGISAGTLASVVAVNTATDQLGTTTLTAGPGITITPGVSTITIADSGVNTSQPCFLASQTTDQVDVTGDGTDYTVTFTDEKFDQNNNFNGTSTFTAPTTGRYLFNVTLLLGGILSTHTSITLSVLIAGTSAGRYRMLQVSPFSISVGGVYGITGSVIATMTAADTAVVKLQASNGTKVVDIFGETNTGGGVITPVFGGFLIC